MLPGNVLLATALVILTVYGEQRRSSDAVSSLDEDCLCPIYTSLSQYQFLGGRPVEASNRRKDGTSTFYKRRYSESGKLLIDICDSRVKVASMYASAKARCEGGNPVASASYWRKLCGDSLTRGDLSEVEANVTDTHILSMRVVDPDTNNTMSTGTIDSPVLLSETYYERAYKTCVFHEKSLDQAIRFGWGLMGYWGVVLLLGTIAKISSVWSRQRQVTARYSGTDVIEGGLCPKRSLSMVSSALHALRTYIVMPASFTPLLPNHQQLLYWYTIPTRLDLLIICGFWTLCIVLACVDFDGDTSASSLPQQNWHYSSDRTGVLAYACLPFLWLFSGRNNVFLWATNFSQQSFSVFHRNIAWACAILSVVHSVNYSIIVAYYENAYQIAWTHKPWYMGVVATIAISAMIVQSTTWLRRKWYEAFLTIHIALGIVILVALFQHTKPDGLKWNAYLWTVVAIWASDRMLRLSRIAYCNLDIHIRKHSITTPHSTVEYCEASNLIKLELTTTSSRPTPKPGQHYFLYQPISFRGWENHPFALGAYLPVSKKDEERDILRPNEKMKLLFYIRPYDGWTKSLRNRCRSSKQANTIHPKLLLEGPYGHPAPLHTFNSILLIAGGTGIAAILPYILDHVSRTAEQRTGRTTRTTRIHLIWSCRQARIFSDVFDDDRLDHVWRSDALVADFFWTGSALTGDTVTVDLERDSLSGDGDLEVGVENQTGLFRSNRRFHSGRPDVGEIIASEARDARTSCTNLAVLASGPARMADDCRFAVYEAMRRGGWKDVEYFEEAFSW
ncbi:ferric reductase transmembrane component 4 precursor [Aspergillus heteromorphus CBS 117.55]|uniref:Ferric reductase transmembrane component 4 n=1 Tax=Aspergillus heteromorphus CBS 117.55 TaxID=1448321 RepID=A0A317WJZ9_9EURO|nr:ferric reductase transmembrane component 4 precursor [Aspergillus heteromorphus CBS 117.55]PWY86776.1 ferric reductase transmembrane component 4 precursor [Aspergillus heteromorphus CBS 117.55]